MPPFADGSRHRATFACGQLWFRLELREHDGLVTSSTRPGELSTGRSPTSQAPGSPLARRSTSRGWRDPRFAVGVVVVAASVLLGALVLGRADDSVPVWAARSDLTKGQTLRAQDLAPHRIRFASPTDAARYLSASDPPPSGAVLSRSVGAGELVPKAAVGEGASPALVQVPVAVDPAAVPATVRVGSHVDVWVTPDPTTAQEGDRASSAATLVFHDVPVLAAPAPSDSSLTPEQSRQLIVGVRRGVDLGQGIAALSSGTVLVIKRP